MSDKNNTAEDTEQEELAEYEYVIEEDDRQLICSLFSLLPVLIRQFNILFEGCPEKTERILDKANDLQLRLESAGLKMEKLH